MYRQLAALLTLVVILLPSVVWAQEFKSLVVIPGLPQDEVVGLAGYVAAFFYISIGVAALFAVVKLVIAGARYMLSDVTNQKEAAKADIRGAVIGLLVILATFIILNTINPQILDVDLALPKVEFETVEWATAAPEWEPNPRFMRLIFGTNLTEAEARAQCAAVDADECPSGILAGLFSNRIFCYSGELQSTGRPEPGAVPWECRIPIENYHPPEETASRPFGCDRADGSYDCTRQISWCTSNGGATSENAAASGAITGSIYCTFGP